MACSRQVLNAKLPASEARSPIAAADDALQHHSSSIDDPWVGKQVHVIAGKNRNKVGVVVRKIRKGTYKIEVDSTDAFNVRSSSMKLSHQQNAAQDAHSASVQAKPRSPVAHQEQKHDDAVAAGKENRNTALPRDFPLPGIEALITGGKYSSIGCHVVRETNVMVQVRLKGALKDEKTVRVQKKNVSSLVDGITFDIVQAAASCARSQGNKSRAGPKKIRTKYASLLSASFCQQKADQFKVPNPACGGSKFGRFNVKKIVLCDESETTETTLLSAMLQSRVLVSDKKLNCRSNQRNFDPVVTTEDGSTFELVSAKVYDDPESYSRFRKPKVMRLMYAQTRGPGLEEFSVADYLLRLGDFSRLSPRKVVARLELLQSPAKRSAVFGVQNNEIELIRDRGANQGCGFASDEMMDYICYEAGIGKTKEKLSSIVALQVRIVAPTFGIFKGMLMRKHMPNTRRILLPDSMRKVLASSHANPVPAVAILINKNGEFPATGSANHYIGRRLDDDLKRPPEPSFSTKIEKSISLMVTRLWTSMGVPREVCADYKKRSTKTSDRNHAWVVGVADPTGKLPPDTVYVTGMKNTRPTSVFITRSPCVHHDDGRVLSNVTDKPNEMTDTEWKFLEALSFSVVIFSNPREGCKSIPERIAAGDLDGDLYLICWDGKVLSSMNAVAELADEPMKHDSSLKVRGPDPKWFIKAQKFMVDAALYNTVNQLISQLYKLGEKSSEEKGFDHGDTVAFFAAYKNALDLRKHGNKIELPSCLHEKISEKFRHFLKS